METKSLLYGLVGFFLGGLIVAIAATTFDKPTVQQSDIDGMSMNDMVDSLASKTGDDFDRAFISGMIEHHQGAIDMAKHAQKQAKHDEIKAMADDIITAQSTEIDMMKKWRADWGYSDASTDQNGMSH